MAIRITQLPLVMAAAGAMVMPSVSADPESSGAVPALTVTVVKPQTVEWPETIVASGPIEPWQEASVGAQIGDQRIAEVLVDVGDVVRQSQVLARLDTELLLAELAELEAALVQAEASRAQAQANRDRAERLRGKGALSEQDILQFVTQAAVAEGQVEAARARVASQRLRLRYTNIVAPDDGVIATRGAMLGAVTQVGEELFRLIRRGRLEWRGELTAEQVVKVHTDARVELSLPDGSGAAAAVRALAPAMTSGSRLGVVYADLEPGSTARAGMYAEGTILLGPAPALVVPAGSLVIRDGRSIVFAIRNEIAPGSATIAARTVTAGRRRGGQVEIMAGIESGDRVVDQGAGFLNDGDVVRIAGTPRAD